MSENLDLVRSIYAAREQTVVDETEPPRKKPLGLFRVTVGKLTGIRLAVHVGRPPAGSCSRTSSRDLIP
jgi:hypothetical protein